MTGTLFVAYTDGTEAEEEIPNHELADTQIICEQTEKEFYVAIELEDNHQQIIYRYKRKTTYVY